MSRPTCDRCGKIHTKCTGHRKYDGAACELEPVKGATVCYIHGGGAPQVAAKAALRAEVSAWGLTDEHVDPAETLLRLVAQSSRRAALYSGLLERAYDGDPQFPAALAGSGVAALIGWKYDLARDGTAVPVEEAVRGLVTLEAGERDRCARFCKLAIDAGLEERRVRLAEAQGAMLVDAIERVLAALGLSEAQRALVPTVVPAALRAIEAGAA